MALDAAMITVTARDLKERVLGARIDKIYMPSRSEALFSMRASDGPCKLLLSARSGSARAHITQEKHEFPAVPPSFCMLLRKHLGGGKLVDISPALDERILFFKFETTNEMGDRVTITVSHELMGRYSNLVLVSEDGTVIDALKRIDEDQSDKRQLYPGVPFTMPPTQGKLGFCATDARELADAVKTSDKNLSEAVLSVISGISPVLCREIAFRVDSADGPANSLTETQTERLAQIIGEIKAAIEGDGTVLNIVSEGDRLVEYSFVNLFQYGGLTVETFDAPGELLERYYAERDRAELMKTRSSDLSRQVNSLYDRAVRKQAARLSERDNSEKAQQKKLYGELINANLHNIEKGQKSAVIFNYYTNQNEEVPLDVTKNAVDNAQKYYKEYHKLTTAAAMLEKLLAEGESEIAYLDAVKYEIGEARSEEDFLLIRKELKDSGYLRGFRYKDPKNCRKTVEFIEYTTSDGMKVLVGRNNLANEKLTLKLADKRDVWFHVKDSPGSHTVLFTNRATPSDQAMTEAANIAAFHSSSANSSGIAVDYTEIKNVRKAAGQKTGMVIYDNYKTAFVTPDKSSLEAQRVKSKS